MYENLITNSPHLISYLVIFFIFFAETGLLIGFFLPGDTLLLSIGLVASLGKINIWSALLAAFVGATIGGITGYLIGRRSGHALFTKPQSRFFKPHYVQQAHAFYQQYGSVTVTAARFIPIVRTFAPVAAGIAEMPYHVFTFYNLIGAAVWVLLVGLAGYYLGHLFPNLQHYDTYIILGVIVISFAAAFIGHAVQKVRSPKA